jgi:hypothetical protein
MNPYIPAPLTPLCLSLSTLETIPLIIYPLAPNHQIGGYAIGGWIVFGAALPSYRTIPDAIVNSVNLVLMGDTADWIVMQV